MKSNFDWPPVTQADNAWAEYAMERTQTLIFHMFYMLIEYFMPVFMVPG